MADSASIRPIDTDDAGEVLTIQRAAFASEALIYGDPDMPPLTQTLEELRAELVENLGCVAVTDRRIVGAVRARLDGELLLIGRLAIAPDQQGEGLGTLLLAAVEDRGRKAGANEAELFTGALSEANQRLYEREGYHRSEETADGEIFYRKALR
ncbi:GNAT family N-acetyltransferase [Microbacterium sp. SORGH_AS_0421]|uniref:GNAT family N-acetyltransferase n=1 Tax=Microbacterium sp. SORGH_AS_0421 TaxID=3041768 RepID=UPI00278DB39C|nr:GNAT family N-acetyltransferase [Microbacterium sp. SORGH_AS_0421]MDQ1175509.1 GNAT superfamily N-acetyltransferase [Microbacterium sp. SORGH_AS_0421]